MRRPQEVHEEPATPTQPAPNGTATEGEAEEVVEEEEGANGGGASEGEAASPLKRAAVRLHVSAESANVTAQIVEEEEESVDEEAMATEAAGGGGSTKSAGSADSAKSSRSSGGGGGGSGGGGGACTSACTSAQPVRMPVEANRLAAEQWLQRARAQREAGDDTAALRSCEKSLKLCETDGARALAEHIRKYGPGSAAAAAVAKVLRAKDDYEVLQLARGASSAEVKKAYKRLSLLLHPDRNHGTPRHVRPRSLAA